MIMKERTIRLMIPVVVLSIGIFYYHIVPDNNIWIPKCPWWLITGTYCPSCGIQRFLHLFLTGQILEAFCMNPFLLISLPYVMLAVIGKWYNVNGVFDKLNNFLYDRVVLLTYTILFFCWWAIRIVFKI